MNVTVHIVLTDKRHLVSQQPNMEQAFSFVISTVQMFGDNMVDSIVIVANYDDGSTTAHVYKAGENGLRIASLSA